MTGRLDGRVAIVTGAGGGIGRAEAILLAREGASVVVNNHTGSGASPPSAQVVADEIVAEGGRAIANFGSVADPRDANLLVQEAIDAFGRLDIVLNNAALVRVSSVELMPDELWEQVQNVSLRGTMNVCRAAIPYLREAPEPVILITGSESGLGHAFVSAYSSAKEGLIGLTRSLARELASDGIRCNATRPRAVGTSMSQRFRLEMAPYVDASAALGRFRFGDRAGVGDAGTIESAAPFGVWLCTSAAKSITGCVFQIEGDLVGLWAEPVIERSCSRAEGWTLDSLDEFMPSTLFDGLDTRGLSRLFGELRPQGQSPV